MICPTETGSWSSRRNCAARRIASSEWPPSAKKSSCAPIVSQASRRQNAAASVLSKPGSGARPWRCVVHCGSGSALRSSLPLLLSGSASSWTMATGTMCAGSCCASA